VKILICDDQPEPLRELCKRLRESGHFVVITDDPSCAVETAKETAFDLVVADLMMPHTDGVQLLETVLEIAPHEPPALALLVDWPATSDPSFEALGAQVLEKPVRLDRALQFVNEIALSRRAN
jgi:two-component system CheB/CheR fusion protein